MTKHTNADYQMIDSSHTLRRLLFVFYVGMLSTICVGVWLYIELDIQVTLLDIWPSFTILATLLLIDIIEGRWKSANISDGIWFVLRLCVLITVGLVSQVWLLLPPLSIVLSVYAYMYFGKDVSRVVLGVVSVLHGISVLAQSNQINPNAIEIADMFSGLLAFIIIAVLVDAVIHAIDRERMSRQHAEYLLSDLMRTQAQLVEFTTTEERNRLARDIHDGLGHYLTIINIQLEKAMAYQAESVDITHTAILTAKQLTRQALQDVRESVSTLRATSDGFDIEKKLKDLLINARTDRLQTDLTIVGEIAQAPMPVLFALYRTIQEGLTNVQKHAQATQVCISITFTSEQVSAEMCDNGVGFDAKRMNQGHGLRGLRERAELLGGTLDVMARPSDGTQISLWLPYQTKLGMAEMKHEG